MSRVDGCISHQALEDSQLIDPGAMIDPGRTVRTAAESAAPDTSRIPVSSHLLTYNE